MLRHAAGAMGTEEDMDMVTAAVTVTVTVITILIWPPTAQAHHLHPHLLVLLCAFSIGSFMNLVALVME